MEFLADYGIFFAKFITVVITLLIIVAGLMMLVFRNRDHDEGHLHVNHLNQRFENMILILKSQILPKKEFNKVQKSIKARHKEKHKKGEDDTTGKKLYVINFKGDIKASEVSSLREEVTSILLVANGEDEVLVRLESGGGTVHGYGLGASQLKRIRDKDIKLTVAVDKVAASGGYMMACVANRIIAAPFAIIGSVGVLAQLPNFNRLLKKHDIDFEEIVAGEYKRTLTLFGENTDKDRQKMKEELEDIHHLFKEFIRENRPQIDIEKIATGEHWYGKKALELNLVDDLMTSDDYLGEAARDAEIYEIQYLRKKPLAERFLSMGARLFTQP